MTIINEKCLIYQNILFLFFSFIMVMSSSSPSNSCLSQMRSIQTSTVHDWQNLNGTLLSIRSMKIFLCWKGSICDFTGSDNEKIAGEFLKSGCSKIENFWKLKSKQLSELMMKFLALLPSSARVVRAFSTTGAVHTDMRNRMHRKKCSNHLFACKCWTVTFSLLSWYLLRIGIHYHRRRNVWAR